MNKIFVIVAIFSLLSIVNGLTCKSCGAINYHPQRKDGKYEISSLTGCSTDNVIDVTCSTADAKCGKLNLVSKSFKSCVKGSLCGNGIECCSIDGCNA